MKTVYSFVLLTSYRKKYLFEFDDNKNVHVIVDNPHYGAALVQIYHMFLNRNMLVLLLLNITLTSNFTNKLG